MVRYAASIHLCSANNGTGLVQAITRSSIWPPLWVGWVTRLFCVWSSWRRYLFLVAVCDWLCLRIIRTGIACCCKFTSIRLGVWTPVWLYCVRGEEMYSVQTDLLQVCHTVCESQPVLLFWLAWLTPFQIAVGERPWTVFGAHNRLTVVDRHELFMGVCVHPSAWPVKVTTNMPEWSMKCW